MRIPNSLLVLALSIGAAPYQPTTLVPELDQVSMLGSGNPSFEPAPAPSRRLKSAVPEQLGSRIASHFGNNPTQRMHVQLDRPLYRPGEDVWFKAWALQAKTLEQAAGVVSVQLVDPSGAVLQTKQVQVQQHGAANDFVLPADAPGGRWLLKAVYGQTVEEHAFVVSRVATPTIQKELDFLREAYGPGETVQALVELTGIRGPLADKEVRAILTVDGETVLDAPVKTDSTGAVVVSGELPRTLSKGDGLLTVLVEEGGVSESISRSVPIVLDTLDLAFFPEGGDLREGLQGRVYFEAKDQHGEPADVEGYVVDDRGTRVADFRSVHDGLGRFAFTPRAGRIYKAVVTAPAGIDAPVALPVAAEEGCVLRTYDDFGSREDAVRVGVRCTEPTDVYVVGVQDDAVLDSAAVHAGPTSEAVVWLKGDTVRQGAVRVTVFDGAETPLAERLVYRGAGRDLKVEIEPTRASYGPRDRVELAVRTKDADGKPVSADLALAVVDDALVSMADDEEGHLLARMYLAPSLVELPDDPDWYFDRTEVDAREGLDLVMGTKGWRRFDWAPVFHPPELERYVRYDRELDDGLEMMEPELAPMARPRPMAAPPVAPPMAVAEAMPVMDMAPADAALGRAAPMEKAPNNKQLAGGALAMGEDEWDGPAFPMGGVKAKRDEAFGGLRARRQAAESRAWVGYAPVRQFPAPDYRAGFQGVRSDFRETVHWAPQVHTDGKGEASVSFYLSDAITTFRVTAEGTGGALLGHGEQTFTSVLPVSVQARIPTVVSAGDVVDLPLTVTSTRDGAVGVDVNAVVGGSLVSAKNRSGSLKLAANGAGTVWMPLDVGNGQGSVPLTITADGGGMTDTLERTIEVVQPGFPRSFAESGELDETAAFTFQLEPHQVGSLAASVVLHPGPTSSLVEGLEGLIRTPGGCFEQTSSTNWPNVAILNYLEANDGDERLRAKSMSALDVGYGRLSGFQVAAGGFETFGSGPGKEVLSAFGLLQFTDMAKLYPVSEAMLKEDVDFLLSRRDGQGGYLNSGDSAHGYGSAPKPVSDGFITYALTASGHRKLLEKEIARQAEVARSSSDPYVLALAARTLLASEHAAASAAVERLAKLQDGKGAFTGAQSSITRSYEANLDVESTALASLALMEAGPRYRTQAQKGVDWLVGARNGGTWGATQATAMALQALTRHAELSKAPRSPGDLIVEVNGKQVGHVHYDADQTEAIRVDDLAGHLKVGSNRIRLLLDAETPLPFAFEAGWTSATPVSDPGAELAVSTTLARDTLPMGETTRLTATVSNRTDRIVPSPIARIGLPAGLEAPLWQLKELQERGVIAFYETRPREVTLYWEGIHPDEEHVVALDLEARVPGTYTAPASSAYPYYNDDEKGWDDGLVVRIQRPN